MRPTLSDSIQDVIYQSAAQLGLSSFAQTLAQTASPAIYFSPSDAPPDPYGHTIGGLPTVPEDFVWPEMLSFVAQIHLADLPPDVGLNLPTEGWLQFFADAEKQEDGPCFGANRRGAVLWQRTQHTHKGRPPGALSSRTQDGIFSPLSITTFPGISLTPPDGYPFAGDPMPQEMWRLHRHLAQDMRSMAAPPAATSRGRHGIVNDEDWLQMGGHTCYFRDGTGYDYRLGATLEKHGLSRDFAWGPDRIRNQIQQYGDTIPDWCKMLEAQLIVFESERQAFEEEARHWVLLLQVPTLNRLGAIWGDDHYVSFLIDARDLANQRFEQTWVLFHP